jgi:hypothetical protein
MSSGSCWAWLACAVQLPVLPVVVVDVEVDEPLVLLVAVVVVDVDEPVPELLAPVVDDAAVVPLDDDDELLPTDVELPPVVPLDAPLPVELPVLAPALLVVLLPAPLPALLPTNVHAPSTGSQRCAPEHVMHAAPPRPQLASDALWH